MDTVRKHIITITPSNDGFGSNIALSYNAQTLVVGSQFSNENQSITNNGNFRTFIYNKNTQIWDEIGNIYGDTLNEQSGVLALNGNGSILVVGSRLSVVPMGLVKKFIHLMVHLGHK